MTKLRDEFQKIVDAVYIDDDVSVSNGYKEIALRIQEYIDAKKPVMLTDDEICAARHTVDHTHVGGFPYTRAIIAAHIAKQKQPQKRTVTVYVYADENGNIFATTDQKCMSPPAANLIDTIVKEYDV